MKVWVVTSAFDGEDRQIDGIFFRKRDAINWVFNETTNLGTVDILDVEDVQIRGIKVKGRIKRLTNLKHIQQCLDSSGMSEDYSAREFLKDLRKAISEF